jgi:hypothetical protein
MRYSGAVEAGDGVGVGVAVTGSGLAPFGGLHVGDHFNHVIEVEVLPGRAGALALVLLQCLILGFIASR